MYYIYTACSWGYVSKNVFVALYFEGGIPDIVPVSGTGLRFSSAASLHSHSQETFPANHK